MAEQVLDLRRIGCSDLAALLGCDPYREAGDVFARIVHGVDTPVPAWVAEAGDLGKLLEENVARAGLEWRLGLPPVPLYRPPSLRPEAREWQRYSLDFVAGVEEWIDEGDLLMPPELRQHREPRILECKVRSSHSLASQGWGDDGTADIEKRVLVQVQGQLEAIRADRDAWRGTDVPDVDVVDVLVLVDGQRIAHYPVAYDAELAAMVREEAERFWVDHVQKQRPPPLQYGEGTLRELQRRYPRLAGEVKASEEATRVALELARARAQRKALEESEDKLHARLAELAGGASRIKGDGWSWSQADQDALKWGDLLKALAARAGLTARQLEDLKNQHRSAPKRVPRLTVTKKEIATP